MLIEHIKTEVIPGSVRGPVLGCRCPPTRAGVTSHSAMRQRQGRSEQQSVLFQMWREEVVAAVFGGARAAEESCSSIREELS